MTIEEILPTNWKLRIRDEHGKLHDLEFEAGKPAKIGWNQSRSGKDDREETAARKDSATDKHEQRTRKADKPERREKADKPERREKPADKPEPREKHAPRERAKEKKQAVEAETEAEAASSAVHKTQQSAEDAERPPRPRRTRPRPTSGEGPGDLVWEETDDDGVPGVRAAFERGAFKILHAGGDIYALFYEWNNGRYRQLSCGPLEALKQSAADWTKQDDREPPKSNLGAEAARVACAPSPTPPPPVPATPSPPAPDAPPPATPEPGNHGQDAQIMAAFEAVLKKQMESMEAGA